MTDHDEPSDESIDDELAAWLEQSPREVGEGPLLYASNAEGFEATWNAEMLDRDIRAVGAEYLHFAEMLAIGRKGGDLTTAKALAAQPKPYAAFVIESVVVLLSRYALLEASGRLPKFLMEAIFWLIQIARQEQIIDEPTSKPE